MQIVKGRKSAKFKERLMQVVGGIGVFYLFWYPLQELLSVFFPSNPSASATASQSVPTLSVWGLLGFGALTLICTVIASILKLSEWLDVSSDWEIPLALLCAAGVGVPMSYIALASTHSEVQSFWLEVIPAGCAFAVAHKLLQDRLTGRKLASGFQPFDVHIRPWWHTFLKDQGVLDDEGVEKVRAACVAYHEKNGKGPALDLSFTVLSPKLFYNNETSCFFTKLHLQTDLDEAWPTEMKVDPFPNSYCRTPMGPRFYIRERYDRNSGTILWDFGIITAESIAKSKDEPDSRLIPIVQLPRQVFGHFYGFKLSDKYAERLEEKVKEAGWKWDRGFCQLEHKYLEIWYRKI